ncbi:hypothetical protein TL16_g01069 [Triparma laevis f. inornata]|uniref:PDZ domain-containing protein n=1 Tax=Triparma laevis f. inornata TaxID=1714386 RepID=A0A9W6ZKL7_9STRA|nr:hypothetical protein TL16_g01069 [Triparma laevis f. inornata]
MTKSILKLLLLVSLLNFNFLLPSVPTALGFGHPDDMKKKKKHIPLDTASPSKGDAIEYDQTIEEELLTSHHSSHHATYDFDVHLPDHKKRVLGINISTDLHVLSFEVTKGSYPWIHETGGVREGDRIVFVDGKDVTSKDLKTVLRALKRAKVLTIRPRENKPREISNQFTPKMLKELHVETNEGHMDVMRGHLVLFSVPVMIADFSGPPEKCNPKRLIWANPRNGCMEVDDVDYGDFENAYVVAMRGDCSFSVKGAIAESMNAAGLIIVNQDERRVEMPIDTQLLSGNLKIPVVMVTLGDGKEMKRSESLEMSRISARLAITSECLKSDAAWHKKYNEEYIQELEETKKEQRANVNKMRAETNSKGERSEHFEEDQNKHLLDGVEATEFFTKRDNIDVQEAAEERHRNKIDSGELTLSADGADLWSLEYETVNIGGYLPPSSESLEVSVIKMEYLLTCDTPNEALIHKFTKRKRHPRALVFDENHMDGVPMSAERALMKLDVQMHMDSELAEVLKQLKGALVTVSSRGAKTLASETSDHGLASHFVRFDVDNFVKMSWNDIRRLEEVEAWPHDARQRKRMLKKLLKTNNFERWPERTEAIQFYFEEAERVWTQWDRQHESNNNNNDGEGNSDNSGNSNREEL